MKGIGTPGSCFSGSRPRKMFDATSCCPASSGSEDLEDNGNGELDDNADDRRVHH